MLEGVSGTPRSTNTLGEWIGIKPHDFVCIPLCVDCHSPETEKELNVELIIINLLMEYIETLKYGLK